MHLERLLRLVYPHIDAAVTDAAAEELLTRPDTGAAETAALREQVAALEEENGGYKSELDSHRKEINRLNTVIVNQRAGWENASPQALAVLAERARQKRTEGYNESHDDEHDQFELSKAAAAYMSDAILRAGGHPGHVTPPPLFPWSADNWKRKPIMRQMEIATALFIADMERMGRNGLEV